MIKRIAVQIGYFLAFFAATALLATLGIKAFGNDSFTRSVSTMTAFFSDNAHLTFLFRSLILATLYFAWDVLPRVAPSLKENFRYADKYKIIGLLFVFDILFIYQLPARIG